MFRMVIEHFERRDDRLFRLLVLKVSLDPLQAALHPGDVHLLHKIGQHGIMLVIRFAEGQRLPRGLPGLVPPLLHGQALGQLKHRRHERRGQLAGGLEALAGRLEALLFHQFTAFRQPGKQGDRTRFRGHVDIRIEVGDELHRPGFHELVGEGQHAAGDGAIALQFRFRQRFPLLLQLLDQQLQHLQQHQILMDRLVPVQLERVPLVVVVAAAFGTGRRGRLPGMVQADAPRLDQLGAVGRQPGPLGGQLQPLPGGGDGGCEQPLPLGLVPIVVPPNPTAEHRIPEFELTQRQQRHRLPHPVRRQFQPFPAPGGRGQRLVRRLDERLVLLGQQPAEAICLGRHFAVQVQHPGEAVPVVALAVLVVLPGVHQGQVLQHGRIVRIDPLGLVPEQSRQLEFLAFVGLFRPPVELDEIGVLELRPGVALPLHQPLPGADELHPVPVVAGGHRLRQPVGLEQVLEPVDVSGGWAACAARLLHRKLRRVGQHRLRLEHGHLFQ